MPKVKRAAIIKPVGDPSEAESTQVAPLPSAKHVGIIPPLAGPKVARKGNLELPSETGLGSMAYSDREMSPLFAQPIGKKGELGRNKWADTALVLVHRAKKAAQTYGKKDFNALYRLVLSAGIAFDKAFPQQAPPLGGNLVIQLFGSLGSETAKAILEPKHPVIDITPLPVVGNPTEQLPSEQPLDHTS